jgi:hypothetical protein
LEREFAELDAELYFMMASGVRKRLGVSDAEVQELAGIYYVDNEDKIFSQILATKKFKGTYPSHDDQVKAIRARASPHPSP